MKPEYPPVRSRGTVFRGAAATTRLREVDPSLAPGAFFKALDFGRAEANQTLATEPLMAYGTTRSNKIIGMLRAMLQDEHWKAENYGNHALSINPAQSVAIVVVSGDANVALDDPAIPEPQPANPKGQLIRLEIENNRSHLYLQGQFAEVVPDAGFPHLPQPFRSQKPSWVLWVLLYYQDPDSGEMRAELSLPDESTLVGSGDQVMITGWVDRIFLDRPQPGPSGGRRRVDNNVGGDPDAPIDVPVERRAG